MSRPVIDRTDLQKLNRERPTDSTQSPHGVGSPTPERVKEAVREANDPRRLISGPHNSIPRR